MESAKSRFLRYVTYYTTSDEFTGTSPSTERQKDLGRALMQELEALKLEDVHMDDCGNVLATLPASEGVDAPVIALIAHMDTAPDASGENVKPRLVRYEGGELKLNDTVSLTEALCPGLESHVGEELIVTDGTTLLGADDKAGVAEIMAAVETMIEKNVKHGEVRVIFTTDEEIGNGVDGLDVHFSSSLPVSYLICITLYYQLPPFVKQKNLLHRFTFAQIGAPRLYSSPPFVVH